ncbi:MAG: ATP-binding protein [Dysgonamonadaceae bacterium]|jgi:hypothetical protein|nr:ATP-binding protein [Dysgonamonadaceae bacterium]
MKAKQYKRLPCGNADFKNMITQNYACVDKTRYIEMLENESNKNQIFIRPRKFGKSLFFTTLMYYYDLNEAENFEQLFGGFYIGKHPTPERNSYAILKFDFSGLDTSGEKEFKADFSSRVQESVRNFFRIYRHVFSEADRYVDRIDEEKPGVSSLEKIFAAAEQDKVKLFLLIDEYDHFANDLISMGNRQERDFYKKLTAANGPVRDFYERIKMAAKTSLVNRTFITGTSPVMLADLTGGYNIADILTLEPRYNEMMGFTREEVEWLMRETGVDESCINVDIETCYGGYLFHADGQHRVYNPAMITYFFEQILRYRKPPEKIIDLNLETNYGHLRRLVLNEGNRETLIRLLKEGEIVEEMPEKFSVDRLNGERYFVSLLFYMGLLTVKERCLFRLKIVIPNYAVKTLFWEYIMLLVEETSPSLHIESRLLNEAIYALAMDGNPEPFIACISKNAFSKLSDYDWRHFDEKYIQILLLSYFSRNKVYLPVNEYETVPDCADIYLQRSPLLPQIKYEWIWALKYCQGGAGDADIAIQQKKGRAQVEQYIASHRLGGCPDLKAAVIVFTGRSQYRILQIEH